MEKEGSWANNQPPPYLAAPEAAFKGDKPIQRRHDKFASVIKSYLSPAAFEVRHLTRQIKAQAFAGQALDAEVQDRISAADARASLQEDQNDPITLAHWNEVWLEFLEIRSQIEGAEKRLPHVAGELVAIAQDGRLKTFARPKGGGEIVALSPHHWAIDPDMGLQRLASCSINPEAYLSPEAPQTHWIFVDKADLDREMQAYDEEYERSLEAAGQPPPVRIAAQVDECAVWLTQQFAADPSHLLVRDDFHERAKEAFPTRRTERGLVGGLSERGFLRAWDIATQDHPERRRPGPRTKKANSPR